MAQFNFKAIGTAWQIDIYRELSKVEESSILSRVMERIERFDKTYSRFRADSLVTKMSKETGVFDLPSDAKAMLSLYRDLYIRTGGLVTPLVGNLLSDAGYDAQYSLKQKKSLESVPEWNDVLEYEADKLKIKKPVMLDFGAAGKGYLVDLVAEVLEANRVSEYCIDAGGDILHKGSPAIRVGLENPENTSQVIGICELQNKSICGSAGNRRKWGNFTHIMNPKTLVSPTEIVAVWVVARSALVADGLATCLFFVAPQALADAYDFEYVLVRSNHSVEKSEHFSGEIFS